MMKMSLGGSEGPAINNSVELSTRVRSEMKGVRSIKETVLYICQRNHASNTFCQIFFSRKQERVVLTRH